MAVEDSTEDDVIALKSRSCWDDFAPIFAEDLVNAVEKPTSPAVGGDFCATADEGLDLAAAASLAPLTTAAISEVVITSSLAPLPTVSFGISILKGDLDGASFDGGVAVMGLETTACLVSNLTAALVTLVVEGAGLDDFPPIGKAIEGNENAEVPMVASAG